MAYSTKAKILEKISETDLAELTCDNASGEPTVVDAVVTAAILEADAWIDAQLGARYAVPFSAEPDAPSEVEKASTAIALWNLKGRRPGARDEETIDLYKHWTGLIKDIARGKASLAGVSEETEMEAGESYVQGNERLFTRDNMKGI